MTALRSHHNTTARVPATFAHLHPDWLPPAGWHDPADDYRDAPASHDTAPTGLPVACNSTAVCPATTTTTPPRRWFVGCGFPPPEPDGAQAEDEDAIFHDPYLSGGPETHLSYTALPLRHRIYALHCQGRTISAIARQLRLDRGTVSRHLHAVEDLLLAEQTADLARWRLRAVEAQHAILAATWDALQCEELLESDQDNDHPYPPRRAQLLATAARAARTAAQLQGLFTPAALAAALRDILPAAAIAPAAAAPGSGLPAACNALDRPTASIASLGQAISGTELAAGLQPASCPTDLVPSAAAELSNAIARRVLTTPPTHPANAAFVAPAASCGMPASAPPLSAIHRSTGSLRAYRM